MKLRYSTSGFTLIELIIGMTIFSIGLTGIYALLHSTMSSVSYSRDEIVVSGLLREQVDLVMNIRDTNLRNYIPWDSVHVDNSSQSLFASGIYLIENDVNTPKTIINPTNGIIDKSPIKLIKVDSLPNNDEEKWGKTQLRMDMYWRYTHSETSGTGTQYGSYLIISPLSVGRVEIKKDWKNQWWIIDVRVLVNRNGTIREYDTKSMITDWQK